MATCASVVAFCSPPVPIVFQQVDHKGVATRYCQTVRGSRIDFSSLRLSLRGSAPAAPQSIRRVKVQPSSVRLQAACRFVACPEASAPAREDRSAERRPDDKDEGLEVCDPDRHMSAMSTRSPSGSSTPVTMALSMSSSTSSLLPPVEGNEMTACPEGGRWLADGSCLLQMQLTIVEKDRSIEALRKRVEELESSRREKLEREHVAVENFLLSAPCEISDGNSRDSVGDDVPDHADLSGDLDAVCLKSEALLREFLALGLGEGTEVDESWPKGHGAEPSWREAGSRSVSPSRSRRSARQGSSTICHSTRVSAKARQLPPSSTRWR